MKKFLAALAAAGLVALISTAASAQGVAHWVDDQLHFKRILGPGIVADSAQISFCGANGTDGAVAGWEADTTAAISMTEMKLPPPFPATQTTPDSVMFAVFHLIPNRTASQAPSGDSVLVYLQVSNDDGGSWHTVFSGGAGAKAVGGQADSSWVLLEEVTPEVYALPMRISAEGGATAQDWRVGLTGNACTNLDIYGWRALRFIVRANGMLGYYQAVLSHWSGSPSGVVRR